MEWWGCWYNAKAKNYMFSKRLGIDLGTANSLVYLAGVGVVLNEPTVVAVTLDDNRVVAVGNEAKEMLGRTPGNIVASRPMKDGVIADYVVTEAMLSYFIDKACGRSRFFKPEIMIAIPAGVTQVEQRAVQDAALNAGAKEVLGRLKLPTEERVEDCDTRCPGSQICLVAEFENTVIGTDNLGKLGKRAEDVGKEAALELLKEDKTGACLDRHMADQILPYLSLASGKSQVSVSEITDHCRTNIWAIEKFIDGKFEIKDNLIAWSLF